MLVALSLAAAPNGAAAQFPADSGALNVRDFGAKGDGQHDDTAALNAWLQGRDAIWADTGEAIGAAITGRIFRLSSAIYVQAGTVRVLRDFRLEWPERSEIVSGGTITAGDDPDAAPVQSGVTIIGGDPSEGVPFDAPDHEPDQAIREASCAVS